MWRRAIIVLAIVFPLLIPAGSIAGVFRSAQGYHISYPDNWQIATESDQHSVEEAAKHFGGQLDFTSQDVIIYNPHADPIPNVNVGVVAETMKASQESLSTVLSGIRQQLASVGATSTDLDGKLIRVGNYDALSSTWTAHYGPKDLHQWQVVIPSGDVAFVITCSASTANYAEAQQGFTQIVNSFTIPVEAALSPEPSGESAPGLSPAVRNIFIIGILGILVIAVGLRFVRVKTPPPSAPRTP